MAVKVENLYKKYGNQVVLDNISFEARPQEILGFLGPNGAGKTTTMKIITGALHSDGGTVKINGQDIDTANKDIKKIVGYLAEHNPLYQDMYVLEFLNFVAGIYKIPDKKKRIEELVEITGLEKEKNKKISQLSKGYKQRIGLAQVLINDPDVLILDEPTSGLDPIQLKEIRLLIKEMGKNKTVILSTHIMQEVKALCDRVIILNNGKIVADKDIAALEDSLDIKEKPVFVQFDREIPLSKLKTIRSINRIEMLENGFYKFFGEDDLIMRKNIFDFAKDNGYTLLTMHREQIDVENVFIKLTGKQ